MPYAAPVERQHARSGSPYETSIGFSRAVRVGDTVAVSGTAPVWPDGSVDPDPAVQAHRCWEIALGALAVHILSGHGREQRASVRSKGAGRVLLAGGLADGLRKLRAAAEGRTR